MIKLLIIFASLIGSINGLGQLNNKNSVNTGYLTTSFNKNTNKVPLNFLGHNSTTIYNVLEKKAKLQIKDEFETTFNYEQRLIQEKNKPFYLKLNEDSLFAFKSTDSNIYSEMNYNADNQELEISIELRDYKTENTYDFSKKTIDLKSIILKSYNYNGINAFGVNKTIKFRETNEYKLLINNWYYFTNSGYNNSNIKLKFSVNPETAKQIKNKVLNTNNSGVLSFLYIGKIKAPYATQGYYDSGAPTLTEPYEYKDNIKYISFDLEEIWIYNQKTGFVYQKILPHKVIKCKISYLTPSKKLNIIELNQDFSNYKDGNVVTFEILINKKTNNFTIGNTVQPTNVEDHLLLYDLKDIIRKNVSVAPPSLSDRITYVDGDYIKGTITMKFILGN